MMHVITGGSGSGKSAYAEMWLTGKPEKSEEKKAICPYLYIATMRPFGAETQKKIERHRQMRAGKGFQTLECYGDLRTLDDSIQRWKRSKSILDINKTCRNEKNQENAKTGGIYVTGFAQVEMNMIDEVENLPFDEEEIARIPSITGYIVKNGDTLWMIAKRYGTTIDKIKQYNENVEEPLESGRKLFLIKAMDAIIGE